jgi:FAD synthase
VISSSQRLLPDDTQPSMPSVGFEPTISASERLQAHVLDRAATVTDITEL